MARSRMRGKILEIEEAFVGHFSDHHGFLLNKMLTQVETIEADLADVEAQIEVQIAPFDQAVERLD